jgi:hypothetical protein
MSKFLEWLNRWNTSVWYGERHKFGCPFRHKEIILIDKSDGHRIHDSYKQYCPCCGAKLR